MILEDARHAVEQCATLAEQTGVRHSVVADGSGYAVVRTSKLAGRAPLETCREVTQRDHGYRPCGRRTTPALADA